MFIIIGNNVRLFGPKKVAVSNEERDNGLTTGVRKTGGASLALPKIRKNPLIGGFQLLDLIVTELKSHMTCKKSKVSHWWKFYLSKKILYKICSPA